MRSSTAHTHAKRRHTCEKRTPPKDISLTRPHTDERCIHSEPARRLASSGFCGVSGHRRSRAVIIVIMSAVGFAYFVHASGNREEKKTEPVPFRAAKAGRQNRFTKLAAHKTNKSRKAAPLLRRSACEGCLRTFLMHCDICSHIRY